MLLIGCRDDIEKLPFLAKTFKALSVRNAVWRKFFLFQILWLAKLSSGPLVRIYALWQLIFAKNFRNFELGKNIGWVRPRICLSYGQNCVWVRRRKTKKQPWLLLEYFFQTSVVFDFFKQKCQSYEREGNLLLGVGTFQPCCRKQKGLY